MKTLKAVSREARIYPAHLLTGCQDGLCLYSAAFLGTNDAVHFARKGIVTTCVDIDGSKLEEMRELYPAGWDFVQADALDYALDAAGCQWDAVSVDQFLGDETKRVLAALPLFLHLARKVATVTIPAGADLPHLDGWKFSVFPRSPRASWLVCRAD